MFVGHSIPCGDASNIPEDYLLRHSWENLEMLGLAAETKRQFLVRVWKVCYKLKHQVRTECNTHWYRINPSSQARNKMNKTGLLTPFL